jgi:hypothetical protein
MQKPAYLTAADETHEPGYSLVGRAAAIWCRLMHENLSWPVKGRYVCRTCGIVYIVPWRDDLRSGGPGGDLPRAA